MFIPQSCASWQKNFFFINPVLWLPFKVQVCFSMAVYVTISQAISNTMCSVKYPSTCIHSIHIFSADLSTILDAALLGLGCAAPVPRKEISISRPMIMVSQSPAVIMPCPTTLNQHNNNIPKFQHTDQKNVCCHIVHHSVHQNIYLVRRALLGEGECCQGLCTFSVFSVLIWIS